MNVKTLCLGVLYGGDATGYEINKACEEGPFSHFYAAGFGSIYPALNALCAEGLVSVEEQPQDKRPDKKVYSITTAGRLHLAEALTKPPGRDRFRSDFWFIMYFAPLLQPRELDALIQQRIGRLRTEIGEMEKCAMADGLPGERFTLGAGLAITRAELEYLDAQRHVLVGEVLRDTSPAGREPAPGGEGTTKSAAQ